MADIILMLVFLGIYFFPTIVAGIRKSNSLTQVFVLNLFLGWTILGWIIALIWAVGKDREYQK